MLYIPLVFIYILYQQMVAQQEVGVSLLGRIVEAAGLKEAGADAPSLTWQISGYEPGVRCVEVVSRRLSPAPVFIALHAEETASRSVFARRQARIPESKAEWWGKLVTS